MQAENILVVVIFTFCAGICFVLGLYQYTRKENPVGFYSGEQPPKKEELTDVIRWNKMHGLMWIGFGICMEAGGFLGLIVSSLVWTLVFTMGSVVFPLPFMIWWHHHLEKKLKRHEL